MSKRKTAEELEEIIERLRPWVMDAQDSNTLRVLRDAVKSIDNLLAKVGTGPQGYVLPDHFHMPVTTRALDVNRFVVQTRVPDMHYARDEARVEEMLREDIARALGRELAKAGAIRFNRHRAPHNGEELLIGEVDAAIPPKNG